MLLGEAALIRNMGLNQSERRWKTIYTVQPRPVQSSGTAVLPRDRVS